jgi:hypothetical protein
LCRRLSRFHRLPLVTLRLSHLLDGLTSPRRIDSCIPFHATLVTRRPSSPPPFSPPPPPPPPITHPKRQFTRPPPRPLQHSDPSSPTPSHPVAFATLRYASFHCRCCFHRIPASHPAPYEPIPRRTSSTTTPLHQNTNTNTDSELAHTSPSPAFCPRQHHQTLSATPQFGCHLLSRLDAARRTKLVAALHQQFLFSALPLSPSLVLHHAKHVRI